MKKLLSILAISGVGLGSTTNFLVSCKQKGKFNLKNTQLYNINLLDGLGFYFDDLLYNISLQIITQYNSKSSANNAHKLKLSDFMYGAKPTKKHPWAIEVMDVDGKTPLAFDKETKTAYLNFSRYYTVLADNALKVKITTTNQNAKTTTVTVNGYLNKFIYTNANLNQGHDLNITYGSHFITTGKKQTVFDISKYIRLFAHTENPFAVTLAFRKLSSTNKSAIFKLVFTAFNKQLEKETKTLNDLQVIKTIDAKTQILDFQQMQPAVYYQTNSKTGILPVPLKGLSPAPGAKLFARFVFPPTTPAEPFSILPGYIARDNTFLFLYLGTTT